MSLERVLEPEVMDTAEEAQDYNAMDHSMVNELFVNELLEFASANGCVVSNVLDLGTGTALIPIKLCSAHSQCKVVAIDMAEHMLAVARENVTQTGFGDRIELKKFDAKQLPIEDSMISCVMSNSIIHHIPKPQSCVDEMVRIAATGGMIFVRDLMRPESDEEVRHLVKTYTGEENAHSQQMFDDSLRAALSLDEIRQMVVTSGFEAATVQATSDRHWTWAAVKS